MRKYLLNQAGIIPIIYVVGLVVIGVFAVFFIRYKDNVIPNQESMLVASKSADIATPSAKVSPTFASKSTSIPKATKASTPAPTQTPAATSTSSTTADNSCSYDLTGPTGAVEVNIKPQSGMIVGDQVVELQAKSGCKVLDGRSTDKQTMIARAGGNGYITQNSVSFSTVPAGAYSVRIQYKGQWTSYSNVDAVATQKKSVEFIVEGGTPPPTPTPKPKPVCSVAVLPSSSGTAPYEASVCVSNNSNPYQSVQQEFADYDGNGSWDYQGAQFGCHAYIFQNPGTFSPKAKIIDASGGESDVCQTSVTVN